MKLILILAILTLTSCHDNRWIVISKKMTSTPRICGYDYDIGLATRIYFQDSCNKYNVGDTIRHF